MTNETGLQFEKPPAMNVGDTFYIPGVGKCKITYILNGEPNALSQIDMSHDEAVRRARNEGLEEAALIIDFHQGALSTANFPDHFLNSVKNLMASHLPPIAAEIRSRITEKGKP